MKNHHTYMHPHWLQLESSKPHHAHCKGHSSRLTTTQVHRDGEKVPGFPGAPEGGLQLRHSLYRNVGNMYSKILQLFFSKCSLGCLQGWIHKFVVLPSVSVGLLLSSSLTRTCVKCIAAPEVYDAVDTRALILL